MSAAAQICHPATGREFSITRMFDAPRELVWQCFTDPAHMKEWWGPKGSTIVASTMDLRVGGTYHGAMRDPEGRVILPEILAEHAHITESAAFVGLGKSFQIWEPARFADHQASLRERARRQGTRLPPLSGSAERRRE